jgi:putative membrane protein
MKRMLFLSAALAAAVSVGCTEAARDEARETGGVGTTGDRDNTVSAADERFFEDLAIANMAEVELGKMAASRAMNAEVKKFGQRMVDEHTEAGSKLKSIASQHNVTLPTALDERHIELRDRLGKLKGAEFDREYMSAMVEGHQEVLDKLDARVDQNKPSAVAPERDDNVVTAAINEWAAESHPIVKSHHDSAKMIHESVDKVGPGR